MLASLVNVNTPSTQDVLDAIDKLSKMDKAEHVLNPNLILGAIIVACVVGGLIAVLLILRGWRKPPMM